MEMNKMELTPMNAKEFLLQFLYMTPLTNLDNIKVYINTPSEENSFVVTGITNNGTNDAIFLEVE
jgi:hypothetical protein